MRISRFPVTKSDLLAMDSDERTFLLGAGHVADEIIIFKKAVIACSFINNEISDLASLSQGMAFQRVLAGKIMEGWEFFNKTFFATKLGGKYDASKLGAKGYDALSRLKKYFGKADCLVRAIRNQYGFHYDKESITSALNDIGEDECWEIFLGGNAANTLFYVSEAVVNHSLLQRFAPSNGTIRHGFWKVTEDLLQVSADIDEFVKSCWQSAIVEHFGGLRALQAFEIVGEPELGTVRLPYFYENPQDGIKGGVAN